MDGRRGVKRGDRPAEERRRAALIAFMRAGSPSPPSTALLVAALAGARRPSATREAGSTCPDCAQRPASARVPGQQI